ncbi:glycosyltransferase [Guptibacillus spartinae]|uniref:glycosyltransferase n=1 Tax=Guptibacillus spartinae TaxID=3025679 RepID=UPI002362E7B8|nr:glycosyltransferase [Pseudalkalibacillus spartinae]
MVTIILTSYNKPKLLEQSLQSVLNQTIPNWELWIMDDNSNKQTQDVIQTFLDDKRITYLNSKVKDEERYKKTRYATLINQALSLSSGKYITYLTDDTTYFSNRLQAMTEYFHENPSRNIVYGGQLLRYVDGNLNVFYESKIAAKEKLKNASNKVDHCSVMHTRQIAENVYSKYGSYWNDDPIFWHNADAEFWSRLTEIEPFYPIDGIFEIALKTPSSFQVLNRHVPDPLPNGILVRGLTKEVYLIDNQKKRLISEKWFNYFQYPTSKIIQIPDPLLFKYQTGIPINESDLPNQLVIKEDGGRNYYFIQENKKRKVPNPQVFEFYSFNQSHVPELPKKMIDSIPPGRVLSTEMTPHHLLPDGRLFSYKQELYLSQKNRLHLIDVNVALKLKFNVRDAIELKEKDFKRFKQGNPFHWEFKTY